VTSGSSGDCCYPRMQFSLQHIWRDRSSLHIEKVKEFLAPVSKETLAHDRHNINEAGFCDAGREALRVSPPKNLDGATSLFDRGSSLVSRLFALLYNNDFTRTVLFLKRHWRIVLAHTRIAQRSKVR